MFKLEKQNNIWKYFNFNNFKEKFDASIVATSKRHQKLG